MCHGRPLLDRTVHISDAAVCKVFHLSPIRFILNVLQPQPATADRLNDIRRRVELSGLVQVSLHRFGCESEKLTPGFDVAVIVRRNETVNGC